MSHVSTQPRRLQYLPTSILPCEDIAGRDRLRPVPPFDEYLSRSDNTSSGDPYIGNLLARARIHDLRYPVEHRLRLEAGKIEGREGALFAALDRADAPFKSQCTRAAQRGRLEGHHRRKRARIAARAPGEQGCHASLRL